MIVEELEKKARVIRRDILKMLTLAGSGHTGGCLSSVEIVTALFFYKMRHDPRAPRWPSRDIFILSKGHAAPLLYAVLARCGYFDLDELKTLRRLNSRLQGHPDVRSLPGVEMSTGSLGQGLSIANGIALGTRMDGLGSRVYVLLGDGEVQEGQVWEAAMTSAHYQIDNLCAIIDRNGLQIDGSVTEVMNIDPIEDKWRAFGWEVIDIDGHDLSEIITALDTSEKNKGRPTIIIAHTVKGKGVSFFEGRYEYHGVAPTEDELKRALIELGEEELVRS